MKRALRTARLSAIAAIAIGSLTIFASPVRADSVVFSDNFTTPPTYVRTALGSAWFQTHSQFSVRSPHAVADSPPDTGIWAAAAVELGTVNYDVSADITLPANATFSGLFARASGFELGEDTYALVLNSTDGTVALYRRNAWHWVLLKSVSLGIVGGIPYSVRLVASGTATVHLEAWVNEVQYLAYDDSDFGRLTTGSCGMLAYDPTTEFTNFTIDSVDPVLFSDYFNRTTGLGANWDVVYGSYTTDGSVATSGTPPINGNWASVVPAIGTNNYAISADIVPPDGSLYSGLVARSADPDYFDSDLYAAQLSTDGTLNLYRRNSWEWVLLSSVEAGIVADTSYHLKLIANGANPVHLEVWLDGVDKIAYDDNSPEQLATGIAGMENYDAQVKYANIIIGSEDPPPANVNVHVDPYGDGGITITSSPAGISCPGTCDMTVPSGTEVHLYHNVSADSLFSGWIGACSGLGECVLRPNYSQYVREWTALAVFNFTGGSSDLTLGTVTSDPAGIGPQCGPSGCTIGGLSPLQEITLTATPTAHAKFAGWTGRVCPDGQATCSFRLSGHRSVFAYFAPSDAPNVVTSVIVNGSGTVTSDDGLISCPGTCSASEPNLTDITLTATPNSGNAFLGWTGACSGTRATCTIHQSQQTQTVTASFGGQPAIYPCGDHPCARGEAPPSSWQPYGGLDSAFNLTVPANPRLINNDTSLSQAIINRMLNGDIATNKRPANFVVDPKGYDGWPTYYSQASDPVYSVVCTGSSSQCNSSYPSIHIPAGAQIQMNLDPQGHIFGDKHITVIDQTTNPITEFDFWNVETGDGTLSGSVITAVGAGWEDVMDGDGIHAGGNGNANAAEVGDLAGRIRAEEWQDAISSDSYIKHALAITVSCTSGDVTYPDTSGNTGQLCSILGLSNVNALPMGGRLWLNMSIADINALGQPPYSVPRWKLTILRTLSVYGAIVMDTGSDGFFTWETESGNQYLAMGRPSAWYSLASSISSEGDWEHHTDDSYAGEWWNGMDGINDWKTTVWSHLEVLDGCVSMPKSMAGSCRP